MLAALLVILVLGIAIIVHEFGHLLFAKLFGVFVERFSVGFGPVLLSKKGKETEYALSLIPFGGYIKMADEDGDSALVDFKKSYGKKPIWQRFFILLAGPLFNFFLGALLFMATFVVIGVPVFDTTVGSVKAGSPAEFVGLKKGDKIITVETFKVFDDYGREMVRNEIKIDNWQTLEKSLFKKNGEEIGFIVLTFERGDHIIKVSMLPELIEDKDVFGHKISRYVIGVNAASPVLVKDYKKAFTAGISETINAVKMTAVGFWQIITGKLAVKDSLGGPIQIFRGGSDIYDEAGLAGLMIYAALININLGFLNLLPIPMLDGGYAPFLLMELIRGKPVSRRTREKIFGFGFAALILLMLATAYFDIMRLFNK